MIAPRRTCMDGGVGCRDRRAGGRRDRWAAEDGGLALWFLGLALLVLLVGGFSLDLWRAYSERRTLAAIADSAAHAAASGVDEQRYRATGEPTLDPTRARRLADRVVALQQDVRSLTGYDVAVTPAGDLVAVSVRGEVPLTLLRLVTDDRLEIEVVAVARPDPRP